VRDAWPVSKVVALIDPLAIINGRKVYFLRDTFGGEVPLSCPYPPLELAFAAALLREGGHRPVLLAANVLQMPHAAVVEQLRTEQPEVVLVPSAWGSLGDDVLLLSQLRERFPDATLLISGPNVTAEPAAVLSRAPVDAVILGEPEEAVRMVADGHPLAQVPNLAIRAGADVLTTERRLPPGWITQPLPARDLLDLKLYTIPFARRTPATTIAASRGCAHSCTFCPSQLWHHRTVRERPVERVIEELEEISRRYGIHEVHFRDDTFTGNAERVHAICDAMDAAGLQLSWRCFGSASTVSPELLQRMAASGCFQVCYGFESGVDEILKKTGKGTSVAQGVDAARWTHEAGMEVSGTFLVGLEGETEQTIDQSIQFAIANDLDYVQVNVAVPLPSTGFGRRSERRGLESSPEAFRWIGADTTQSATMDGGALPGHVKHFYRRFYLRPSYVAGRLTSRRGLHALVSHARLGAKMMAAVLAR